MVRQWAACRSLTTGLYTDHSPTAPIGYRPDPTQPPPRPPALIVQLSGIHMLSTGGFYHLITCARALPVACRWSTTHLPPSSPTYPTRHLFHRPAPASHLPDCRADLQRKTHPYFPPSWQKSELYIELRGSTMGRWK